MLTRSRTVAVLIGAVLAVVLLVSALPASARYPAKLSVAVHNAYSKKVKITDTCKKTLYGNQLYALVAVEIVSTGKASTLALQFINTNGWFAFWKDNKVLPAVPKAQRDRAIKDVNKLRAKCA
jgi:hypothetical protein